MFKQRDEQYGLFEAPRWPNTVASDSFYGRLSKVSDVLFSDQDLAAMYCADNGRPCLPPAFMCCVTLLQFYDNVSDEEAVSRLEFDLRWKVALNLPLDFRPPHPSSLSVFRKRLLQHGQERYGFNRLVEIGRKAGLVHDKVTLLVDTTPQRGAGAVLDTYTLIRKATRQVLREAGYNLPGTRQGLAADLAPYLDSDKKADIDWSDPAARDQQLKALVRDAEAVLDLVQDSEDLAVRTAAYILAKILGDDIEPDEQGQPRIAQGVAPDRIMSLTDPEMRHGRKSAARRFDGRKVQVATDAESGVLLAVEPIPASDGDGRHLQAAVHDVEEQHGVQVERVIADGAYGSGDNRAQCQEKGIDLVSPVATATGPHVHKSTFALDTVNCDAICPEGQHATTREWETDNAGRPILVFGWDRATCEACPKFQRCVRSRQYGRRVRCHFHESLLRDARARQQTPAYKALYGLRSAVERAIAHLVRLGLRRARYFGTLKAFLQDQWTGAAVNFTILFRLLCGDIGALRRAMAAAS